MSVFTFGDSGVASPKFIVISLVLLLILLFTIGVLCFFLQRKSRLYSAAHSLPHLRTWLENHARMELEPDKPEYFDIIADEVTDGVGFDKEWTPIALEEFQPTNAEELATKRWKIGRKRLDGRPKQEVRARLCMSTIIRMPTTGASDHHPNMHSGELVLGTMDCT
ncbi:SubName: Full=Uncharacterized protein {ECO:0000313/EMBL:CCA73258.1} [Serendipita indica DSM 11827]|uniref:Uncharacterized protein n=1 Tax=Serendipita indica (strain DSM 11827) TaxID=1109443 RepID=G4TPL5_SERID|nr:SubName: Full=Uncharacterized protein {ECO:0000313/EMBL:CCA73258.1} [Serendipita indica DSM 11827]CCA73258.1 hypothetical protein PIIN_07213 [Serendipita indica DSM 11827]